MTTTSNGALLTSIQALLSGQGQPCAAVNVEHVISILGRASGSMDIRSGHHLEQVAVYALLLAQKLDLSYQEQLSLRKASLLHDIGKLAIQDSILLKKGPLSVEEREQIKLHPSLGESICGPLHLGETILSTIRHHHERYDGAGYPDGLKGQAIPLFARVVALADAYDAMTTGRPYRDKLSPEDALAGIEEEAGRQFDPSLASAFCSVVKLDR